MDPENQTGYQVPDVNSEETSGKPTSGEVETSSMRINSDKKSGRNPQTSQPVNKRSKRVDSEPAMEKSAESQKTVTQPAHTATFHNVFNAADKFKSSAMKWNDSIKRDEEPQEPLEPINDLTEMVKGATELLGTKPVVQLISAVNGFSRKFVRTSKSASKSFPDLTASHPKHR